MGDPSRRLSAGLSRSAVARLAGCLTAVAVLGLTGCGADATSDDAKSVDEASASTTPEALQGATDQTCAAAIPDAVLTALAWQAAGASEEHTGRCQRSADQGQIVVGTIATVDSAQKTYDARCATLPDDPGATMVDWLGDRTACASTPDASSGPAAGVSDVYVLDKDAVIEVRVEALQPVSTGDLHAGVAAVLDATEPVVDQF